MMYQSTAGSAPEAARLEDYLRAMNRHKYVVIALTALGLVAALAFAATRTSTYTGHATVVLRPSPLGSVDGSRLVAPNLETEREILASNSTAEAVIEELAISGTTTAPELLRQLEVDFRPDSDVINVNFTASTPQTAATAANSFAQTYVNQREQAALDFYQASIQSASEQIEVLNVQAVELSNAVTTAEAAASNGEASRLRGELNQVNTSIRNLQNEAQTAQRTLATRVPAGEVLRSALPPEGPDGIPRSMLVAAGLFLGGLIGFVTAFLLERLDTTARDSEDVALALGTTVMGSIPTLGIGRSIPGGSLIMLSSGGSARISAAREAFRRLRSSVQFLNSSSGVSSIIVTSSSPSEGKSLVSANLAIALAQNGSRCVLVSADLRRPTQERLFSMEGPRPGLSEYLSSVAELNAEKVPGIDNLWIIRSGAAPANPGELLSSDRFEQMIKELEREDVEYIVIDTPPVLSTADAVSAARYVDGVIVVVDAERTETTDLLQVRADLERSGSKLLGSVMNRQKFERAGLFKRNKHAYYKAESRRVGQ